MFRKRKRSTDDSVEYAEFDAVFIFIVLRELNKRCMKISNGKKMVN